MERAWAKVSRGPGCWEWTGKRDRHGYGRITEISYTNGKRHDRDKFAHRVIYAAVNGLIPDGMVICHRCDNPPCCNPSHLFAATQTENLEDMTRKGRRAFRGRGKQHAA